MIEKLKYKSIYLATIYLVVIMVMLNTTVIFSNNSFVYDIVPILILIEFLIILINSRKIFETINKKLYLFIILYFVIRLISFIFRFDISNFKTLFYELFFLVNLFVIFDGCNVQIKNILKFILTVSSLMLFMSIIFLLLDIIFDFSFIETFRFFSNRIEIKGIFSNPNTVGIFAFITICLYTLIYIEKKHMKFFSIIFIVLNLVLLYFSNSRTAILAILFFGVMMLISFVKKINFKNLLMLFKIGFIIVLIFFFFLFYFNEKNPQLTSFEYKINELFTNRYVLWKYTTLSLDENILLGVGNTEIANTRFSEIPQNIKNSMEPSRYKLVKNNNNTHNSFIQIIGAVGIINLILFILITFKKINTCSKHYVICLMSIFVLSFFENELLISKSIIMIIFSLLLANNNKEKLN